MRHPRCRPLHAPRRCREDEKGAGAATPAPRGLSGVPAGIHPAYKLRTETPVPPARLELAHSRTSTRGNKRTGPQAGEPVLNTVLAVSPPLGPPHRPRSTDLSLMLPRHRSCNNPTHCQIRRPRIRPRSYPCRNPSTCPSACVPETRTPGVCHPRAATNPVTWFTATNPVLSASPIAAGSATKDGELSNQTPHPFTSAHPISDPTISE